MGECAVCDVRDRPSLTSFYPASTESCANASGERPATAVLGGYLRGRAFRRLAGTRLSLLVSGFVVSAASNKVRMPGSNNLTAFSKAPRCANLTIAAGLVQSNYWRL